MTIINQNVLIRGLQARRRKMLGLSLVELMISIALALVILTAVTNVFLNTSASRNEIERTSRQIENGRYAVELLSDDVRLAGFMGELNVSTLASPGALPDPCSTTLSVLESALPLHLQGYPAGSVLPSCVPTIKSNTDVLVVRRVRSCAAGVAGCPAAANGSPYLQISLCESEAPTTPYALGLSGTATFTLRIRDCATRAALRQFFTNIYFISDTNGAGQNIPTLKRMEFTGSGFTETPLVEGIEFFRISYGVDKLPTPASTRDGSPEAYTSDPATYTFGGCTDCNAIDNWRDVVTAHIHVLARNIERSPGHTDNKTYTLGNDSAGNPIVLGPFSDGYRRHVYTNVVRVVNPSGRRDQP